MVTKCLPRLQASQNQPHSRQERGGGQDRVLFAQLSLVRKQNIFQNHLSPHSTPSRLPLGSHWLEQRPWPFQPARDAGEASTWPSDSCSYKWVWTAIFLPTGRAAGASARREGSRSRMGCGCADSPFLPKLL